MFHRKCFVCNDCRLEIGEASFTVHEDDGKPYHTACFENRFLVNCVACAAKIRGEIIHVRNGEIQSPLHVECFTCGVHVSEETENRVPGCRKAMTSGGLVAKYYLRSNTLYCSVCIEQFLPNCAMCNIKIKSAHNRSIKADYRVRNGVFYCAECDATLDKRCFSCQNVIVGDLVRLGITDFHPSCIRCSECAEELSVDGVFFRDGKLYCANHLQPSRSRAASTDPLPSRSTEDVASKAMPTSRTPSVAKLTIVAAQGRTPTMQSPGTLGGFFTPPMLEKTPKILDSPAGPSSAAAGIKLVGIPESTTTPITPTFATDNTALPPPSARDRSHQVQNSPARPCSATVGIQRVDSPECSFMPTLATQNTSVPPPSARDPSQAIPNSPARPRSATIVSKSAGVPVGPLTPSAATPNTAHAHQLLGTRRSTISIDGNKVDLLAPIAPPRLQTPTRPQSQNGLRSAHSADAISPTANSTKEPMQSQIQSPKTPNSATLQIPHSIPYGALVDASQTNVLMHGPMASPMTPKTARPEYSVSQRRFTVIHTAADVQSPTSPTANASLPSPSTENMARSKAPNPTGQNQPPLKEASAEIPTKDNSVSSRIVQTGAGTPSTPIGPWTPVMTRIGSTVESVNALVSARSPRDNQALPLSTTPTIPPRSLPMQRPASRSVSTNSLETPNSPARPPSRSVSSKQSPIVQLGRATSVTFSFQPPRADELPPKPATPTMKSMASSDNVLLMRAYQSVGNLPAKLDGHASPKMTRSASRPLAIKTGSAQTASQEQNFVTMVTDAQFLSKA